MVYVWPRFLARCVLTVPRPKRYKRLLYDQRIRFGEITGTLVAGESTYTCMRPHFCHRGGVVHNRRKYSMILRSVSVLRDSQSSLIICFLTTTYRLPLSSTFQYSPRITPQFYRSPIDFPIFMRGGCDCGCTVIHLTVEPTLNSLAELL